jgi:hypothetical protein
MKTGRIPYFGLYGDAGSRSLTGTIFQAFVTRKRISESRELTVFLNKSLKNN